MRHKRDNAAYQELPDPFERRPAYPARSSRTHPPGEFRELLRVSGVVLTLASLLRDLDLDFVPHLVDNANEQSLDSLIVAPVAAPGVTVTMAFQGL